MGKRTKREGEQSQRVGQPANEEQAKDTDQLWTDLETIARGFGFGRYAEVLRANGVTATALSILTREELQEAGIPKLTAISITAHHEKLASIAPAPAPPAPTPPPPPCLQNDQPLSEFWAALAAATEERIGSATFLILGGGNRFPAQGGVPIQGGVADGLLVRECYKQLAEQATDFCEQQVDVKYLGLNLDEIKREPIVSPIFILRGNPGIGKSLFHLYFMKDLAASGKTVVWQRRNSETVLFTQDGALVGQEPESLLGFMPFLRKADTWFLCDGLAPVRVAAKTLLVTYPDHEKIKEALKWPTHQSKWMPVWDLETELIPAGTAIFKLSEEMVKANVKKWGPIPRYALQKTDAENKEELDAAISGCSLSALESCFSSPDTAPTNLSDRLICIQVSSDYQQGCVHFASEHVEKRVLNKFEALSNVTVKEFLAGFSGDAAINSFRRKLLECMRETAHDVIQKGGCFKIYNLQTQEEEDIVLPDCQSKQTLADPTAVSTLPEGVYGKKTHNLGGIDAIVKPGWLFQIRVSENYAIDISTKALVDTARQMGGFKGLKFVWILHPIACTPHFEQQTFWKVKDVSEEDTEEARKIPQYVLELKDLLPNSIGSVGRRQ